MATLLKHTFCCAVFLALAPAVCPVSAQIKSFDTATVRPCIPDADPNTGSWTPPGLNRFTAIHLTLERLLMLAYGVDASQIANKPAWLTTNLYDINAKAAEDTKLTADDVKTCLQNLLQERFHLKAHTEVRPQSGYALLVAKGGPHLTPTTGDHRAGFRINVSPGHLEGYNWTMPYLARMATGLAGFPVVDCTGIPGSYDIHVLYEPDPEADASSLPTLTVAVRQTLGLELKPGKVPVESIVIDNLDKTPTDN
jgi:uncharacterized protein (TIGR03435 family)